MTDVNDNAPSFINLPYSVDIAEVRVSFCNNYIQLEQYKSCNEMSQYFSETYQMASLVVHTLVKKKKLKFVINIYGNWIKLSSSVFLNQNLVVMHFKFCFLVY